MKTITMEKRILVSGDKNCHSYAEEHIIMRRNDTPGGKSFLSMEFVNLEPDEEFPAGCLCFDDCYELEQITVEAKRFLNEIQQGQDENGDLI